MFKEGNTYDGLYLNIFFIILSFIEKFFEKLPKAMNSNIIRFREFEFEALQ